MELLKSLLLLWVNSENIVRRLWEHCENISLNNSADCENIAKTFRWFRENIFAWRKLVLDHKEQWLICSQQGAKQLHGLKFDSFLLYCICVKSYRFGGSPYGDELMQLWICTFSSELRRLNIGCISLGEGTICDECDSWDTGPLTSFPGFCFFHFVLRFWNQILIWVSDKPKLKAKFNRSQTDKYRVVRNLFSNATSCSYVYAVRIRRDFELLLSVSPIDTSSSLKSWFSVKSLAASSTISSECLRTRFSKVK